MTIIEAKAEVFVTAFKALTSSERETIIHKLMMDRRLREDIQDIIVALQRENEPSIPYEQVRRELQEAGRL